MALRRQPIAPSSAALAFGPEHTQVLRTMRRMYPSPGSHLRYGETCHLPQRATEPGIRLQLLSTVVSNAFTIASRESRAALPSLFRTSNLSNWDQVKAAMSLVPRLRFRFVVLSRSSSAFRR
jgi:hypothetical protein